MSRSVFRKPSLKKRLAARTSLKRYARNNLGLKAPRGLGWLTNPRRAAYNRLYNRTSVGCMTLPVLLIASVILAAGMARDLADLRQHPDTGLVYACPGWSSGTGKRGGN